MIWKFEMKFEIGILRIVLSYVYMYIHWSYVYIYMHCYTYVCIFIKPAKLHPKKWSLFNSVLRLANLYTIFSVKHPIHANLYTIFSVEYPIHILCFLWDIDIKIYSMFYEIPSRQFSLLKYTVPLFCAALIKLCCSIIMLQFLPFS